MAGRAYSIFDTSLGRCGIAWGPLGVVSVQLPESREIETLRRMLRQHPDAREQRPPPNVEIAIEGIGAVLGGKPAELSDVILDLTGIHPFDQRVYQITRAIPCGETRTCSEVAAKLGAPGAAHSVARAIAQNPFMIIVPCHRVLETGGHDDRISANGGVISRRRLLSIEGTVNPSSKTLFDVLLPVAPSRRQG